MKHGSLENGPFGSVIFLAKSTSIQFGDFPACHVADSQRVCIINEFGAVKLWFLCGYSGYYPLVNKHSYWKLPFTLRFPIESGDFPVRYVSTRGDHQTLAKWPPEAPTSDRSIRSDWPQISLESAGILSVLAKGRMFDSVRRGSWQHGRKGEV